MRKGILILILLFSITTYGQSESDESKTGPTFGLRAGLLDYFHNEYPSHDLGLEAFFSDRLTAIVSTNVYYQSPVQDFDLTKSGSLSLEGRFYFQSAIEGPFFGFRGFKRNITFNDRYTLGFECNGDNCVYYSDYNGPIKTTFKTIELVLGAKTNMYKERLTIEYALGLGKRNLYPNRSMINGGRFVDNGRLLYENDFGVTEFVNIQAVIGFYFTR